MSKQPRYTKSSYSSTFESMLFAPDVSEGARKVDEQAVLWINQDSMLNSLYLTLNSAELDPITELYREGRAYITQRDWPKAVEIFTELVRVMPTSEMYSLLGVSYLNFGDLDRAASALDKVTTLHPDNGWAQLCLGLVYMTSHIRYGNQDKLRKAVRPLRTAIQLDYEKAHAYLYLGIVYRNLRNWEGAEAAFQEATKLEANFSDAYERLGRLYLEIGANNEHEREQYFLKATQALEKVTEIEPNRSDIHSYIGYIHERLGNLEAALKAYGTAAEANGDNFIALINFGITNLNLERYKDAMLVFERIVRSDPQVVAANIAGEAERRGKDPNNFMADAYTCYGVACMELFDTELESEGATKVDPELLHKAESAFKEAIKLDPDSIKAHFDLAVLYYRQNRLEDAKKAIQRVLEIDPSQEAKEKVRSLLEEQLKQRLFEDGLLKKLKKPITDFTPYQNRTAIVVQGKPVSETLLEDRR